MSDTNRSHEWRAGTATAVITPAESMRMAGYGAREDPSEGTLQDLHAKAIALEDGSGTRFVAVGVEVLAISRPLHEAVTEACEERYDLPPSHLLLNASHTHCGPVYRERKTEVFSLDNEERAQARAYAERLEESLVDVVGRALEELSPASVTYSHARCGIAMNRRVPLEEGIGFQPYPDGPVDHDVPVLAVESPDGGRFERSSSATRAIRRACSSGSGRATGRATPWSTSRRSTPTRPPSSFRGVAAIRRRTRSATSS
ncbi:neutral/alkaline non-lysosomal ceramidase N-terminal domain-containing protein [Halalkalicoccus salilacus]|uniref:neutral/alkaline non-lysosomal ceramidase N-terminal domain-containing protein n=1 Tax=Halalkalicoccus sp. GCM10025704 TaxID=3252662 RepID=UPI0036075F22